jgi:galactose-1-phosphate uridylyltransferase
MEGHAVPELEKKLTNSAKYFAEKKSNYFVDLVEAEKKEGSRYIGGNDSVEVMTSFAPRGNNEVCFIFKDAVSSLTQLSEKQINDFAVVLAKVLLGYKNLGLSSFNLISFSGPSNDLSVAAHYRLHFKLISRPSPKGLYTNDTGPFERMYDSWVIDSIPEQVAESIRAAFKN